MTDLKKVRAITVEPTFSISAANMKMIHAGVRLLLVTNGVGTIIGLITATDILGEKPMQYMINAGGLYEDIQVQHIMTPREALEVLQMTDVAKAQVGNIVETLKRCGRQHALVVDADKKTNKTCVRGIFSSTQIGRQMGVKLDVYEVVHSFAELGQVLSR
jgi:CBS domain-containing protein